MESSKMKNSSWSHLHTRWSQCLFLKAMYLCSGTTATIVLTLIIDGTWRTIYCPQASIQASKSKRNGRGPTRGMGLDKIMQATGRKLAIQIDPDNGRPLNAMQSTKLSSKLGIIARNFMRPVTKWKEVSETQKDEIFGRLNAHFDIDLNFDHVRRCCEMLLRHQSPESRYRLHERFKAQLKDCGSVEEVHRKPPIGIEEGDWNMLINMWANPKWEERSQKNKQNRSKNKFKHNIGSKAFVVIREEIRDPETKEEQDLIDHFRNTHYNKKDGWVSDEARDKYTEMLLLRSQLTESGERVIDSIKIMETVFGRRSGYVKGLEYGPIPSTVVRSSASSQRVSKLEEALKKSQEHASALETKIHNLESNIELMMQWMPQYNGQLGSMGGSQFQSQSTKE